MEQGQVYTRTGTPQSAVAATGNGTPMDVTGLAEVVIQVSGTFTATVGFEVTANGTNYVSVEGSNVADGTKATSTTAAGIFRVSVGGMTFLRTPVTWTSGTSVTVITRGYTVSTASLADVAATISGSLTVGSITATTTVPTQFSKIVAASGTPEVLAADGTFFRTVTLMGLKAARTNNTGTVYLGIGATNDTQPLTLTAGDVLVITAPLGQQYDLNDFYLDVATNGDGVFGFYS